MKLTELPKFAIWAAIAVFSVLVLYSGYLVVSYKFFKPYQKYLEIDCKYSNNTALVILTAKKDIRNITVWDIDYKNSCIISYLAKDSMDVCKVSTKKINNMVLVRVAFNYANKTYRVVKKCEIEEKKSLLDLLR